VTAGGGAKKLFYWLGNTGVTCALVGVLNLVLICNDNVTGCMRRQGEHHSIGRPPQRIHNTCSTL
jgi:hypothetical protein